MPRANLLTAVATRVLRLSTWLRRRPPLQPPQKLLILQPCCLREILLTTPLLAVLNDAFPAAQIDWAVSDLARPALAGNPRLTNLVRTGPADLRDSRWADIQALTAQIRTRRYDTCVIPTASNLLSLIAWRAAIPQRIGLNIGGRGFAHTVPVLLPSNAVHAVDSQMALALAMGVEPYRLVGSRQTEFYPHDTDRTAVTQYLVEEADWLGATPLVVIQPGGLVNGWPVERFALLANHLHRRYQARLVIVGDEADKVQARELDGLTAVPTVDFSGRLTLGQFGALCEVADLYVGNGTDIAHVAVASRCPTLAIYGPNAPNWDGPYAPRGHLEALWQEYQRPFGWKKGITVAMAIAAADRLLRPE